MKKLLSFFLAISTLTSLLLFTVSAADFDKKVSNKIELSGTSYTFSTLTAINSVIETTDYLFGNQLSGTSREIYDALVDLKHTDSQLPVVLSSPLTYKVSLLSYEQDLNVIGTELTMAVQTAIDALIMDYPQIFWLKFGEGGTSYSFSFEQDLTSITVDTIIIFPVTDEAYADDLDGHVDKLNSAVENFIAEGNDRYSILLDIHDKLAKNIIYRDVDFSHEAYGALVEKVAVCEGYAEAYILLCRKYEIPCIGVLGTSFNTMGQLEWHKWNYVQMDDGNWYAVDVTWDDGLFKVYHDYFLVGQNSIAHNFDGNTFNESHFSATDFSNLGFYHFVYPTLSQDAYVYDTQPSNPQPTQPMPDGKDIVIKEFSLSSVSITENDGEEYSIDGVNWQKSGHFDGLSKNVLYTFYSRVAAVEGFIAGNAKTYNFIISGNDEIPLFLDANDEFIYDIPIGVKSETTDLSLSRNGTSLSPDKPLATGDIITVGNKTFTVVIKGEVNCDSMINSTDFMQIRRQFLGLYNLSGVSAKAADVNRDGNINSTDFMLIRRHYLGLHNIFA